ncbi:MAG: hypothetical protein K0Q49_2435 [Haloplasmataceae bacterium]|jgi:L-ascorbate metabolism protein UlaG (beta-lactamase superfamily)|nr:hypothetical protein [Haloplasmataceae bacterium]
MNIQDKPRRTWKGIIKKVMIYFLSFVLIFTLGITLFLNIHPVFGGSPTNNQEEGYKKLDYYAEGKFVNFESNKTSSIDPDSYDSSEVIERNPKIQLSVSKIDWDKINNHEDSLTWFGHSTFLLTIDNLKILIDPMLGPIASPVSFVGPKRYSKDLLDAIEKMPPIDSVLITHDHYDHLDYTTIKKLNKKVKHFFVPYGVSTHLIRWGIPEEKITELGWWDETEFKSIKLALTPSKHFSGRGIFDRNSTLWGGWVIIGKNTRLYNSGDGGYDSHFKKIGEKYGPFDMTLIEGGQYDKRWSGVHMTPEESVQAHLDVKGNNMMLMHWGAFTLANHGWSEPVERALVAAKKSDVNLITPEIGETVKLEKNISLPISSWWK